MSEKQHLSLDEIPLRRWIALIVADFVVGELIATVIVVALRCINIEGEWSWLPKAIENYIPFIALFVMFVVFLKAICKTTLREFLVGEGNRIDWRQFGIITVLYLAGFLVVNFVSTGFCKELSLNDAPAATVAVNFLIALACTWMQTSWEELVFRGTALRWSCGNKIRVCARSMIAAVVISAAFMSVHLFNPEVTSQSNVVDIVAMALCYFFAGFFMYVVDLAFGDLMPGCAIHWINNFVSFAVINQVGTALQTQAILIDHTSINGVMMLLTTFIAYAPVLIYAAVHWKKARAAEA